MNREDIIRIVQNVAQENELQKTNINATNGGRSAIGWEKIDNQKFKVKIETAEGEAKFNKVCEELKEEFKAIKADCKEEQAPYRYNIRYIVSYVIS